MFLRAVSPCRWWFATLLLASCAACRASSPQVLAARTLADLSLEELRDVVISSVSRRDQPLLEAPASIYVIEGDDIRRLGITRLPEALRLAPTLEVAALDARQYAISARGFNSNIANKLLVMVDGRTIYSPLFSGVFWDAQDFVPAQIDRIEVITGPAGATWGTNAVNGVINVVTLPASRTQGASAALTTSSRDKAAWANWGTTTAGGMALRAHVDAFDRAATLLQSGAPSNDAARGAAVGLRADWADAVDSVALDAGAVHGRTDERPQYGAVVVRGAHLLGRWSRKLGDDADFELQGYVDTNARTDLYLLQEKAEIADVEAKLRRRAGAHRLLVGAGHRRARDDAGPGLLFAFLPPQRNQSWTSLFGQDEIALADGLELTLGVRFEHNPYTGWETMPSARVGWRTGSDGLLWGALSRAVRSPARLDREIYTPPMPPFLIAGGPTFRSEIADVLEVGWRGQLGRDATLSATAFVHDFEHLRSAQIVDNVFVIGNRIAGTVRGVEGWANWQPLAGWRLAAGLLYLDKRLHLTAGSNDPVGPSNLGNDPRLQWQVRSTHALGANVSAALWVRHVGELPQPAVPAYTAVDLRLAWRFQPRWELAAGVRNAGDDRHVEFASGALGGTQPRFAFVSLALLSQ